MKHLGLFEGIGGFSLAARWMGWETKAWCEWNPFGQQVLRHHFPEAEGFGDITKTDFKKYANRIDILTGGFPCQPFSLAGKRKGTEDERHLWPEMLRAIGEIQPRYVVGENVLGLVNWDGGLVFEQVQIDLEAQGYEVWPYVLPACAVNAPHRRDRIWFVAHRHDAGSFDRMRADGVGSAENEGRGIEPQFEPWKNGSNGTIAHANDERCQEQHVSGIPTEPKLDNRRHHDGRFTDAHHQGLERRTETGNPGSGRTERNEQPERLPNRTDWRNFPTQSPVCSGDDGIPAGLDGITLSKWRNESIKAGGNAIVPQVALQIFKAIEAYENLNLKA